MPAIAPAMAALVTYGWQSRYVLNSGKAISSQICAPTRRVSTSCSVVSSGGLQMVFSSVVMGNYDEQCADSGRAATMNYGSSTADSVEVGEHAALHRTRTLSDN